MDEVPLIPADESVAMSATRKRARLEAPQKGSINGGVVMANRGKEQSPETFSTKQSLSNGINGLANGAPGDESSGTYTGTSV